MPLIEVPDLALDLINDALEYHSHAIVTGMDTGEDDVVEHWKSLRYFWKLTSHIQPEYGRMFHRSRLAELVLYACRTHPLGDIESSSGGGFQDDDEEPKAMVYWSPKQWDKLRVKLLELNQSVRREDANLVIRSPDDERPNIRPGDCQQQQKLKHIMDRIVINKHLSRIRKEMEQWCRSTSIKQPHIQPSLLNDFVEDLDALRTKDHKKFSFLRQFLARNSEPRKPKLAPMSDLEPVLKSNNCDLEVFAADILSLIMDWNKELFHNKQPALYRIGYGDLAREPLIDTTYAPYETDDDDDVSEGEYYRRSRQRQRRTQSADFDDRKPPARASPKEIAYMRSARAALRQSAPDPLEETCEAASKAGTRTGRIDSPFHRSKHNQAEDGMMAEQGNCNYATTPDRNGQPRTERAHPSTSAEDSSRDHDSDTDDRGDLHAKHYNRRNETAMQSRSSHRHQTGHSESTEFTSPSSRAQQERLKRKRRADLNGDEDDSTEITELEARASPKRMGEHQGTSRPSSRKRQRCDGKYAKKKSAQSIDFGDSEEEVEDDGNDNLGTVRLSDLPRFASGTPPRRRIVVEKKQSSGPQRRKFFSKEEKIAIREGVRKHGTKWRKILEDYSAVLSGRTNVQIKDCARTMKNNGEIDY